MAITLDPDLLSDLKRHGAFDVSACFHCGNCTAVCPLSEEGSSFPRRLIRLGQLGDRSRLLEGPDAWLCYYCGECSDTCPREAEPGEYMASLRRYVITQMEPTGLARLMYRSVAVLGLVSVLLAVVLGAFLVSVKAPIEAREWLFNLVPYATIHLLGVLVFVVSGLTILVGGITAFRRMLVGTSWPGVRPAIVAALRTVGEIITMSRHRCETPGVAPEPWYRGTSGVHLAIFYGFMGLLLATTLDFLFLLVLPLHLTVFWPARVIGTVAGVLMMFGVTLALWRRFTHAEKSVGTSHSADWWVLVFLFVLGATGFWLEIAVTLQAGGAVSDIVLLVHAAMAMELVLLLVFTKMAHIIYRPIAVFVYFLRNAADAGVRKEEV